LEGLSVSRAHLIPLHLTMRCSERREGGLDEQLSTARSPTINTYGYLWSHRADEAVRLLVERGYREFELMLQPPQLGLTSDSVEAQAIARMVNQGTIRLHTLNMPSLDHNLTSAVPEMRSYTIDLFVRQIRLAGAVGAD